MMRRLGAWAGALAIALLAAELALRWTTASWQWVDVFDFSPHPACFTLQPGAAVTYEGMWQQLTPTAIAISSAGVRDREYPPAPPVGVLRILALGDSQVFGLGLPAVDSLPRQLEAQLAARLGRPVEVINAGVPGYDLAKMVARTPEWLARFRPHVVAVFVDQSDFDDVPCAHWHQKLRPFARQSALVRGLYLAWGRLAPPAQPTAARVDQVRQAQFARLAAVLSGAPEAPAGVVVAFSALAHGPTIRTLQALTELEDRGFAFVSLADEVQVLQAQPDRFVIAGDGHFNRDGVARLAALGAERMATLAPISQLR